jgi:hypothetical protein
MMKARRKRRDVDLARARAYAVVAEDEKMAFGWPFVFRFCTDAGMDNKKTITRDFLFRVQRWRCSQLFTRTKNKEQTKPGIHGPLEFLFSQMFRCDLGRVGHMGIRFSVIQHLARMQTL